MSVKPQKSTSFQHFSAPRARFEPARASRLIEGLPPGRRLIGGRRALAGSAAAEALARKNP